MLNDHIDDGRYALLVGVFRGLEGVGELGGSLNLDTVALAGLSQFHKVGLHLELPGICGPASPKAMVVEDHPGDSESILRGSR